MRCRTSVAASVVWSVADGAVVDRGQVVGTAGDLASGTLTKVVAPCAGTFRLVAPVNGTNEATASGESVVQACVEYCTHPLRNGRTCLMCLAAVEEHEEMEAERGAVNIVSHGQVLRVNAAEARTLG